MAGDSRSFRDGGARERSVFRRVLSRRFHPVFFVPEFVASAALDVVARGDALGCCVGKCLDPQPDQLRLRFQDRDTSTLEPQTLPQGLKPFPLFGLTGTVKTVP